MTKEELEYNRGYRYGYERGELNGYKLRKSEEKHCEDAISKASVFEIMGNLMSIPYDLDRRITEKDVSESMDKIRALPPVTPTQKKEEELETKTGYWFVDERPESNREIICSNCEHPVFKYHKLDFDYRPNYCPNCGAKMESEE